MRLAMVAAGFTPGEADQLRRAMGGWRRPGVIEQFRQRLVQGMLKNGFDADYAERVFKQIQGFGEYGFPESHAASFALLVYVSAWLKRYYPAAFTAALINSQPMGFYAPAQLVRDARDHGVDVLPADVNHSDWDCTLEWIDDEPKVRHNADTTVAARLNSPPPVGQGVLDASNASPHCRQAQPDLRHDLRQNDNQPRPRHKGGRLGLRLGLRLIVGLAKAHAERIVEVRQALPREPKHFRSLEEFTRLTGLGQPVIERLAKADAFASLGADRRNALWEALQPQDDLPLFCEAQDQQPADEFGVLVPMSASEEVVADYQTAGLSLKAHPMAFHRKHLKQLKAASSIDLEVLPNNSFVRVAGIVLLRQRPSTANGVRFVTLEDETGQANLIVRPDVWEEYRRAARGASALLASGRLQRHEGVIHVLVTKLEDLSLLLAGLRTKSRDFR